MIRLIRQLAALFDRRERWQLALLTAALVLRAAAEIVGVASVAPFMSIVADPGVIQRHAWLARAYDAFGFTSTIGFLTAMGATVIVVLAASNTVSALALWGMLRFSWSAHHRLSMRLLKGYLAQPYSFFVERNSASLSKTILSETRNIIEGVLTPSLNVLSRSLVVVALTGLLVVLDPVLAGLVVCVLGGAYGGLYLVVRRRQRRLGRDRNRANEERFRTVEEAFGGIKDVKVLQREAYFLSRLARPSWTFSCATAENTTLAYLPRYLLETIALGGVVLIVLYHLRAGVGVAQILPVISLYAFAGYRLVPELQQIFIALGLIQFYRPALDEITADLARFPGEGRRDAAAQVAFGPGRGIRLEEVTFRYPGADLPALKDVTLHIPRNTTVGLVGRTGSGKTTLVDLLLGLYAPEQGRILVDGVALDGATVGAWRRRVGYVPQQIFLCDDSIAANIAFGIPPADVDAAAVERAGRIANLQEFVATLPDGYSTLVGERGVRLSGGQRQRIGIARALYHDPDVLVMDEATSALDGATESAVMDAIRELTGRKTIVLIAHRLTTVQQADVIYLLRGGRVEAAGTYSELIRRNASFRAMANA